MVGGTMGIKVKEVFWDTVYEEAKKYLPSGWTEELEKQEPTIGPTVVIGLGTTGTYCLAYIKKRINDLYKGNLSIHTRLIQYLALDTVSWGLMSRTFPEITHILTHDEEYIFLGGFIPSDYVNEQFRQGNPDLTAWFPDEYLERIPGTTVQEGAQGIGLLGRLALYYHRDEVESVLSDKIEATLRQQGDLIRQGMLPPLEGNRPPDIQFYIIGGSYGGTARGIFMDMLYLCNKITQSLGAVPRINLFIFMPRIAYRYNRRQGDTARVESIKANSHAFFRELQYILTDGVNNLDDWRFDSPTIQQVNIQRCYFNNVFLIDTEVAGQEIDDRRELLNLTSEFIFTSICAPHGSQMTQRRIDMTAEAHRSCAGRPAYFSSFGVSCISAPLVTYARLITATNMLHVIDQLVRSPDETEKRRAKEDANNFMQEHLKVSEIENSLKPNIPALKSRLPSSDSIMRESSITEAARRACDIGEDIENRGRRDIDEKYEKFLPDFKKQFKSALMGYLSKFIKDGTIVPVEYLSEFLSGIKLNVRSKNLSVDWDKKEADTCDAIYFLETHFAFRRKQRLKNRVVELLKYIDKEIDDELEIHLNNKLMSLSNEVKQIVDDYKLRLQQFKNDLDSVKNIMKDEIDNKKLYDEECPIPTTTQMVPFPPDDENKLNELRNRYRVEPSEIIVKDEFSQLVKKYLEGKANTFVVIKELTRLLIRRCEKLLNQTVVDILGDLDEKDRERYLRNLSRLCDPTWSILRNNIPANFKPIDIQPTAVIPVGTKNAFPPTAQFAEISEQAIDPRYIMAYSEAHSYALFMIRDADHKREYDNAVKRYQTTYELPPHIKAQWNRNPDLLPDIEPVEGRAAMPRYQEAFAIGLFTDWLIRYKKDRRILNVMKPDKWSHTGVIYSEGTNTYRIIPYERRNNELHRQAQHGELLSSRGRVDAARNMSPQRCSIVNDFFSNLSELISPQDLKQLMDEYITFIIDKHKLGDLPVTPRERRHTKTTDAFKLQVCNEIDALREVIESM